MKRDLLICSTVALAVCLIISRLWGSPEVNTAGRLHNLQSSDPNLKLVTERSPYMRTER
jgi:hypothetical protein